MRLCITLVLFSAVLLSACGSDAEQPASTASSDEPTAISAAPVTRAVATLSPTEGNTAAGTVTFTAQQDGLLVEANLTGLSEGMHGFHVHAVGDCSAPDGTSAGGHFNPGEAPHGAPDNLPSERHVGDLGNAEADADGNATYERVDAMLAFEGAASIIGKAVIVHGGTDDLTSQPSGAAGPRVACGVIEVAE
ncbi:MAG: superoxide dismutase family protein [Rhodothermales bacterium]